MEKVKIVTGIVYCNSGKFLPYFWIDNQGFDLNVREDLEDAEIVVEMAEKALRKLNSKAEFMFNKSTKHYWGNQNELKL